MNGDGDDDDDDENDEDCGAIALLRLPPSSSCVNWYCLKLRALAADPTAAVMRDLALPAAPPFSATTSFADS